MSRIYEPVQYVTIWIDGGIHIKTREPHGDPVELSSDEALALADLLRELAQAGSPPPWSVPGTEA